MTAMEDQVAILLDQEQRLRFETFSYADGVQIGLELLKTAQESNLPIVIDVFAFGQQLFHAAMPGTRPDNGEWVARKRSTVLRFAQSSLLMGAQARAKGIEMEARYFLPPREYSSHGGSFPIHMKSGGTVGAITVSGLAQEDDHALVVSALEAWLQR